VTRSRKKEKGLWSELGEGKAKTGKKKDVREVQKSYRTVSEGDGGRQMKTKTTEEPTNVTA